MDGLMGGWTDGLTDGWTDGRTDGWMDGRTDGQSLLKSSVSAQKKIPKKSGSEPNATARTNYDNLVH